MAVSYNHGQVKTDTSFLSCFGTSARFFQIGHRPLLSHLFRGSQSLDLSIVYCSCAILKWSS